MLPAQTHAGLVEALLGRKEVGMRYGGVKLAKPANYSANTPSLANRTGGGSVAGGPDKICNDIAAHLLSRPLVYLISPAQRYRPWQ